ncbi:hypothetical protein ES332_A05G205900v1 [Gossypium tomentosum]|uniref:Uncharacterized protein n=1 Tax=Gossypium tomentosum TaxID=34277 RepID=A0A5D2QHN4_GOSTO|nr:hypothetical protein ES332_A05G205900v1 [Gossypium tomentosum]
MLNSAVCSVAAVICKRRRKAVVFMHRDVEMTMKATIFRVHARKKRYLMLS